VSRAWECVGSPRWTATRQFLFLPSQPPALHKEIPLQTTPNATLKGAPPSLSKPLSNLPQTNVLLLLFRTPQVLIFCLGIKQPQLKQLWNLRTDSRNKWPEIRCWISIQELTFVLLCIMAMKSAWIQIWKTKIQTFLSLQTFLPVRGQQTN